MQRRAPRRAPAEHTNGERDTDDADTVQTVPLYSVILRVVLILVFFFIMFAFAQTYILEPMRGVHHVSNAQKYQQVMDRICPPGNAISIWSYLLIFMMQQQALSVSMARSGCDNHPPKCLYLTNKPHCAATIIPTGGSLLMDISCNGGARRAAF